jgi:hypothetical protein
MRGSYQYHSERETVSKKPQVKAVAKKKAVTKKAVAKKKVVASKKTVAKKVVAKKSVAKKAVPKKAAPKKAAPKKEVSKTPVKKKAAAIDPQMRYEMIEKMAYYCAKKRHFAPGHEYADWLASEKKIDEMLSKK